MTRGDNIFPLLPCYSEDILNVFKHDLDFEASEDKYKAIKKELLDESSSGSGSDSSPGSDASSKEEEEDEEKELQAPILDMTETNLIALRRTIYLTIQSSLDYEEAAHKLMKMNLKPGHEPELCHMILGTVYRQFFDSRIRKSRGFPCSRLLRAAAHLREVLRPASAALLPDQPRLHRSVPGHLRLHLHHRAPVGDREAP